MPNPEQTPDGRLLYTAVIGKTTYKFMEPLADDISRVEREIAIPYESHLRRLKEGEAMPETYLNDQRYVSLIAAIVEPRLTAEICRKWKYGHYIAVRSTVMGRLKLDQQDDVFFPDESDGAGARDSNERVPVAGHVERPSPENVGDTMVAPGAQVAERRDPKTIEVAQQAH